MELINVQQQEIYVSYMYCQADSSFLWLSAHASCIQAFKRALLFPTFLLSPYFFLKKPYYPYFFVKIDWEFFLSEV